MRILLSGFILLIASAIFAQDIVPEVAKEKRTLDLTFRLDHSLNFPKLNMNYEYNGEFIDEPYYANPGTMAPWRMIDTTIVKNNWTENYDVRNANFSILVSATEHLNIGFGYNFTFGRTPYVPAYIDSTQMPPMWVFPEGPEVPYFMDDLSSFITLGPIIEYEFPIWKGLELTPSIFVGSYQSGRGLEGAGREFYLDARLAAEYVLWKRLGIRAYVAYDKWGYREDETSEIFRDQQRTVKTDWSAIYGGLGLSYRFKLRPE